MILIFSNPYDGSTHTVLAYLKYHNYKYEVINDESTLSSIHLNFGGMEDSSLIFSTNSKNKSLLKFSSIRSFWYRRNGLNLSSYLKKTKTPSVAIKKHLWQEIGYLKFFVSCFMSNEKRLLGNFRNSKLSKLQSLYIAKKTGLDTPRTLITDDKIILKKFLEREKYIITKAIQENTFWSVNEATKAHIDKLPSSFFPTLVQEKIDKKYELRVFFINEDYYAMAIFSQLDEQTKVDFRNYNYKKPNRMVPYILPNALKDKLKKLMKQLILNTGSIDIVVTSDNRFVFLEVNPVGQFGFVSENCNYYLEEKIADFLAYEE